MAAVKKANIVPLVAVLVVTFSMTVQAFAEGIDSSSIIKKLTEGKSDNAGIENKKKVAVTPTIEAGGEKSSNESEKKPEGDKKANADIPSEKQTTKQETKPVAKPQLTPKSKSGTEKPDKQSDKPSDIIPPDAILKKLEKSEKSDKSEKGDKKEQKDATGV